MGEISSLTDFVVGSMQEVIITHEMLKKMPMYQILFHLQKLISVARWRSQKWGKKIAICIGTPAVKVQESKIATQALYIRLEELKGNLPRDSFFLPIKHALLRKVST